MAAARRREIDVCGTRAAYWEYGPADATETIVAVHGFRGDHHGLEPVVAHLPEARVLMPDLPGFGATPPMERHAHDLDGYARFVTEFIRSVAPGATVLGHSFGSIIVSAAVAGGLSTPQLILVNPIGAPALEGPRGVFTRLAVLYYWLGARLPRRIGTWLLRTRIVVRVMSLAMVKSRDKRMRAFVHDQHDRYFSGFSDRDVLREAFVASVSHDVTEYASRIDVPTLMIAADRDDITHIEAERVLRDEFPRATLVELSGVGHLIHYEKPSEAADAIRSFLTG
ncbi:alpha/beta fold hydrolase [Microbacterium sp. JB110]|uniref:alpha/beta fold hydrolase n=1 Tax=Microbacterium sp. JB110 TaxID=2024477 RepID=UPI000B364423|nr:alpha/beta hydrolase [Microbacterium sp. JB110]RCS62330.1 alpha/beta hydrolase [Microbacterium sp. JB110]